MDEDDEEEHGLFVHSAQTLLCSSSALALIICRSIEDSGSDLAGAIPAERSSRRTRHAVDGAAVVPYTSHRGAGAVAETVMLGSFFAAQQAWLECYEALRPPMVRDRHERRRECHLVTCWAAGDRRQGGLEASQLVGYVGPRDLHDAKLVRLEHDGDRLRVHCASSDDRAITMEFTGVATVNAVRSQGTLLYGLAEFTSDSPMRRFVFANWDEDDDATLEVLAREVRELTASE